MTQDFVKVRSDLSKHPLVVRMAKHLLFNDEILFEYDFDNIGQNATVNSASCLIRHCVAGAVIAVTAYFEEYGKQDGNDWLIEHFDNLDIDDVIGVAGIGDAMAEVGWLVTTPACMRLSNEAWGD